MKWVSAAVALIAVCGVPAAARADSFDPVSVGVQASTLGLGISLERPLLFNFSARIATGLLSVSDAPVYGNGAWTRTFQEQNVLLVGDWRPSSGRYRLSAGVLLGGDHTTFVARPQGQNYLINGSSYPVAGAGVVSANVGYGHPAFYAGVGGGTGILRGFTISFDAGLVLRNGSVTASATGPLQSNPQFNADLQAVASQFRTRWIQPVIEVGLAFRP